MLHRYRLYKEADYLCRLIVGIRSSLENNVNVVVDIVLSIFFVSEWKAILEHRQSCKILNCNPITRRQTIYNPLSLIIVINHPFKVIHLLLIVPHSTQLCTWLVYAHVYAVW